jgi:hypothetical protein
VAEFIPLANVAPSDRFTNAQNYLSLAASPTDQGVTNIRVDYRFSDRDSLMVRFSDTRNTRAGQGYGLGPADPDTFARHDQRDNLNVVLTVTRVLTPNTINEFKAGATRQYLLFAHISYGQDWPAQLGMSKLIPQDVFPSVSINGVMAIGPSGFPAGFSGSSYVQLGEPSP